MRICLISKTKGFRAKALVAQRKTAKVLSDALSCMLSLRHQRLCAKLSFFFAVCETDLPLKKEHFKLKANFRAFRAGRFICLSTLLLLPLLASACQQQQVKSTNQPAANQAAATQTPQPVVVKPPSQETKQYHGVGVVTKVVTENPYDKSLASVELNHEEIVGLMPPMTMEFYVKEKSLLKNIKVGDKVDFTIEEKGGTEIISQIKKQ